MRSTGQERKKDKKLPLRDNSCNGYFAFYRRGGFGRFAGRFDTKRTN